MTGDDPFVDQHGNFHLPPGDRTFAGCVMEGYDLVHAKVSRADLSGVGLYWGQCQHAVMEGTIFDDADLRGAHFDGANMRGASLQRAALCFDSLGGVTQLHNVDLTGADLRDAEIHGAEFLDACLAGADLRGCRGDVTPPQRPTRFDGADLTGAQLEGARLAGAQYDARTRFPRGFDPVGAGMVMRRP